MRIENLSNARQAYYDRNPLVVNKFYNAQLNPHVITVRWSYTVPASRKAVMESGLCYLSRYQQLVTTLSFSECFIRYTPNGGSLSTLAYAFLETVVPETFDRDRFTGGMTFIAGDLIEGVTDDYDVGGQMVFILYAKFLEFDA